MSPTIAPYGSWTSPITPDALVAQSVGLGGLRAAGDAIHWIENRPNENRSVLVRRSAGGALTDLTPAPFNVRTRVHEYGGGAYVLDGATVTFANFTDQALYRQVDGATPTLFHGTEGMRYADAVPDPLRGRLILVREDHTGTGEAVNTVVALDQDHEVVLAGGADFYASPRLSPDGSRLAWIAWYNPQMPWDGTELWVADVTADGSLLDAQLIAGGRHESLVQPEWGADGTLYVVSDRSGWWNIHRVDGSELTPVAPMAAECAQPHWVFGRKSYQVLPDGRLIVASTHNATDRLAIVDPADGSVEDIETGYSTIEELSLGNGFVALIAGSPTEASSIVRVDLATHEVTVLRRSSTLDLPASSTSVPTSVEFSTEGGLTAFGFYYPPANADFVAPDGELPPLLVFSHGGPTAMSSSTLRPGIQFWTSRGFAVVDVNYGGSTGFGRDYRRRLNGTWGVVDVDDSVNAATFLVQRGLADGDRLAIRGGSAGGYTTLCALTFRDFFKAGASHFGVGDVEALARDTHKFEARYLDSMIGPYPQEAALYQERSPILHTELLSSALILLQGLEDKVVPPNQAQTMYDAVLARGLPVAYVAFEGEGHGFRAAASIKRAAEAELYFYGKVFGFTPAGDIEPVDIANV